MEDTKTAKQQNKKDWEEAGLGINISAPPKPEDAGKDAGRGSNGKNGKDGSSASGSGSGSSKNGGSNGVGGWNNDKDNYEEAMKELEKSKKRGRLATDESTNEKANTRNFSYPKGKTKDGHINGDVLGKEKEQAKNALEKAKQGNKKYQGLIRGGDSIQEILDMYKKAFKNGDDKLNPEELRAQAEKEGAEAEYYKNISKTNDKGELIWSWDKSLGANKEWAEMAEQAEKNRVDILEKAKRGEDFQSLMPQFNEFVQQMGSLLGYQVDEHGKWAAVEGTQTNKYQAEIAQNLFDKINTLLEDGKITQDELETMGTIYDFTSQLAQEEYRSDKNIQKAEDQYNSANAKSTYYLLDQIKTWAVFLIGLSQGNPTMVYSAMEQFNKKIADAEADYKVGEIKAFENNNVKDITGEADAQYTLEQIFPGAESKRVFDTMDLEQKSNEIKKLKDAYDTYQKIYKEYGDTPNGKGFQAWFTNQSANSGSSGWGLLRDLITAGALNWEALQEFMEGGNDSSSLPKGKDAKPAPKGKEGAMLDPKSVIDTSGIVSGLAQGLLQNSKPHGDEITKLRNKQGAVNDALASRGQGLALQGNGTASPVNKSWGRG